MWALALVVLAVAGAGIATFALVRGRHARASSGPRAIALLPFVDRTHDPMLDFATAGLPNLLGLELHAVPDVTVLGYYRLVGITGEQAPREAWLAAARQLGADVAVQGEITEAGGSVHVALQIDALDGTHLGTLERDATLEGVPEVVRRTAGDIAAIALGRRVEIGASEPTSFAADRELQLGIAALDREHLADADSHLRAAIHHAPDSALAHYYYAITLAWNTPPAEPVHDEIAKALATGKLDEAQRGMLAGIGKLADLDYTGGVDILRPLAEKYGDDREILYALFECLFHGGRPAEAMSVYRRIHAVAPKFRLALLHAFTFYTSHGDDEGMQWALALNEPTGDTYNPIWESRVLVAHRDYQAAIALLSKQLATTQTDTYGLHHELVTAYAVSGQLELALSVAKEQQELHPDMLSEDLFGLGTLRGDDADRRARFDAKLREYALRPQGPSRAIALELLLSAQDPVATRDELAALDQALAGTFVPT
jgi:tetratricopeptide (TPR) repeat protein/TolB-like protein